MMIVATAVLVVGVVAGVCPVLAELSFRKGFRLVAQHRYAEAIEPLKKTKALAPLEAHYLTTLSQAYQALASQATSQKETLRWLDEAEQTVQTMIRLDQNNPWHRNQLATVYLERAAQLPAQSQRLQDTAYEHSLASTHLDPNNPLFLLSHGFFCHQTQRIDEAKALYRRVIDIDSDLAQAPYNLALLYHAQHEVTAAIRALEGLYTRQPAYMRTRWLLGGWYEQVGRWDQALALYEQATVEHPEGDEGWQRLALIHMGQRRWDQALPILKRLSRRHPDRHRMMYVQALLQAGLKNEGYAVLRQHLAAYPNDQEALRLWETR